MPRGEAKEPSLRDLPAKAAGSEDAAADGKTLAAAGAITAAGTVAKATGAPGERVTAAASAGFSGFALAGNAFPVLSLLFGSSFAAALADGCGAVGGGSATGNCARFNPEPDAPVCAFPSPAWVPTRRPTIRTGGAQATVGVPAILNDGARKERPDPPCAVPRAASAERAVSGAASVIARSALGPFRSASVSWPNTAICACQLERKLCPACASEVRELAGASPVPAVTGVLPAGRTGTGPWPGSERPPAPVSIAAATVMGWIH